MSSCNSVTPGNNTKVWEQWDAKGAGNEFACNLCHVLNISYQQTYQRTVAPSTAVQVDPSTFVCKMQHNLASQRLTQQQLLFLQET